MNFFFVTVDFQLYVKRKLGFCGMVYGCQASGGGLSTCASLGVVSGDTMLLIAEKNDMAGLESRESA